MDGTQARASKSVINAAAGLLLCESASLCCVMIPPPSAVITRNLHDAIAARCAFEKALEFAINCTAVPSAPLVHKSRTVEESVVDVNIGGIAEDEDVDVDALVVLVKRMGAAQVNNEVEEEARRNVWHKSIAAVNRARRLILHAVNEEGEETTIRETEVRISSLK